MPLYDFTCVEGHRFERVVPLALFGEQQACECGADAKRMISAPRVMANDMIPPTRGADGQMHTSLSSYRHSLTPEGNPRGESFAEIGNTELPHVEYKFDRAKRREDIKAGIEDVRNGRVPLVATGDL